MTQSLLAAGAAIAIAALTATSAEALTFAYQGHTEYWTVPFTGDYRITATGAGGGGTLREGDPEEVVRAQGGRGVRIGAKLLLTKDLVVAVSVGGVGGASGTDAGGGGGTFVVTADGVPLVIAGGGGGAGVPYSWEPSSGEDGVAHVVNGGFGGLSGGFLGAGGGGGFFSDGQTATMYEFDGEDFQIVPGAGGGQGYPGLAGGIGLSVWGEEPWGGFGGGGGAGECSGGGGGGYGGGRGGEDGTCDGSGGGGGGSYIPLGGRFLGYGERYHNGLAVISYVPEPATWVAMLVGFGAIGAVLRRRRSAPAALP